MTLTKEQSSRKTGYESYSTEELSADIGIAKECNRIDEDISGAVDEALDRLAKIEALIKSIDLTKCSPLPWKSQLHSYPIADTGDYDGSCDATDAIGKSIVAKFDDNYREVEMDDGDHDADILAICDSVNAVSEIKKIITPNQRG